MVLVHSEYVVSDSSGQSHASHESKALVEAVQAPIFELPFLRKLGSTSWSLVSFCGIAAMSSVLPPTRLVLASGLRPL